MPGMGIPDDGQNRGFRTVTMAPRDNRKSEIDPTKISAKEKERLISRVTGYHEKNKLYKKAGEHNKMGKDEFLKLLTVQLKNQDPMKPMEQGKMAAELAQFSQLEQLSNLNKHFEGQSDSKAIESKFYGASFLGKEVVTAGSSLKYDGEGSKADVLFSLPAPASKVLVRIFDNKNNMVGEMWKENIGRGNQTFTWDGVRLDGAYAGKGEFKTQVMAWDKFADPISVETKTTGTVSSVYFENGETVLVVDNKKVFLRDVDSFHTPGVNEERAKILKGEMAMPKQPNVNVGRSFNSPLNNAPASNVSAKSGVSKLPLATEQQSKVNLKKNNTQTSLNAYKQQAPTTGLTNVYDVE